VLTKRYTDTSDHIDTFNELKGAAEYAVYGWSKWDYTPAKSAWHPLFRLTSNKPEEITDGAKIGDRTLAVWVGDGYLHFTTYTFDWHAGHNPNWI